MFIKFNFALKALFLFLDRNVRILYDFNYFLHIIYAYMITFTLFICLIQIQNGEIYTAYHKSAKKHTEIWIFAHITQPYFVAIATNTLYW